MKKLMTLAVLVALAGCAAPRTSIQTKDVAGTMVFKVKPNTADVAIDGNPIGKARDFDGSGSVAKLPPGKHTVLVSAPGYVSWEGRVYLNDSQEKVEVVLQKAGN